MEQRRRCFACSTDGDRSESRHLADANTGAVAAAPRPTKAPVGAACLPLDRRPSPPSIDSGYVPRLRVRARARSASPKAWIRSSGSRSRPRPQTASTMACAATWSATIRRQPQGDRHLRDAGAGHCWRHSPGGWHRRQFRPAGRPDAIFAGQGARRHRARSPMRPSTARRHSPRGVRALPRLPRQRELRHRHGDFHLRQSRRLRRLVHSQPQNVVERILRIAGDQPGRRFLQQHIATSWSRSEAAGDPGPWRQQAILGRGQWDAHALRDIVRDYALETAACTPSPAKATKPRARASPRLMHPPSTIPRIMEAHGLRDGDGSQL